MQTEIERRPFVLLATGLTLGLVLSTHWPAAALVLALLAFTRTWNARAVLAVAVLTGVVLSPRPVPNLDKREFVEGVAIVTSVPKLYPDRETSVVEIDGRRMLLVTNPGQSFTLGDRLRLAGIAKPLSAILEPIYTRRRVCAKLTPIRLTVERGPVWPLEVADQVRRSFIAFAGRTTPASVAALLDALCFNVDTLLDERTEESLTRTGTIHLVSASGLQVLILTQSLLLFLSLSPVPRPAQIVLVAGLLTLYAMAAGLHGPITRAVLASILASSAYLVRREPDVISALCLAATIYLLWRPYEVYQPGFQLSFVITGAFALFLPRSTRPANAFQAVWRELRPSLVASVAGAPLVAYHFGYLSPVGLLANALSALVVPMAMVLSMAGFAASFLWAPLGSGLVAASIPLVGWLHASVQWCSSLAWASVPVPAFSAYWLIALYGAALLTWRRRVVQA